MFLNGVRKMGWISLVLPLFFLLASLFYLNPRTQITDGQDSSACRPNSSNDWCAPSVSYAALSAKSSLEKSGLECRVNPTLSNFVIFEYKSGNVEALSFDDAVTMGSKSEGWSRFFCD